MTNVRAPRFPWRGVFLVFLGAVVVAGTGAAWLVVNPPKAMLLDFAASQIKARTGYDIAYGNGSSLTVWPKPVIVLNDFRMARPQRIGSQAAPTLANAQEMRVELELVPLLSGDVQITKLHLKQPDVTLLDEDLRAFGRLGGNGDEGETLAIRQLTVEEGVGHYVRGGPNPAASFNITKAIFDEVSPLGVGSFEGEMIWHDEPVAFKGNVSAPSGGRSDLKFEMTSRYVKATFDGQVGPTGNASALGQLDVAADSLVDLLLWLNFDPGPRTKAVTGKARLTGQVIIAAQRIEIKSARIETPAGSGTASLVLDSSGVRPRLTGDVAWDNLDLTQVFEREGAQALMVRSRSAEPEIAVLDALADLSAFLAQGGRQPDPEARRADPQPTLGVAPTTTNSAWSSRPIDLDGLKLGDFDLRQRARSLTIATLNAKDVDLHSRNENGRLTLDLRQAGFAGGNVGGKATLDTEGGPVDFSLDIKGQDVRAETLTGQMVGLSHVEGATGFHLELSGRGKSPDAMISTLGGQVRIDIADGRIVGYDLRRIYREWWRKWSYDRRMTTPFRKVAARLRLSKGVVSTVGVATMRGPIEIDTSGWVSLPRQSLDHRVRFRLEPPPTSLQLPIRLQGPWSEPKPSLDLAIFSLTPEYYTLPAVTPSTVRSLSAAGDEELAEASAKAREILANLQTARSLGPTRPEAAMSDQRAMREKITRALAGLAAP